MQFRLIFAVAALLCGAAGNGQQVQPGNAWDDYKKAEAILNDGLLDVYSDPTSAVGATPWVTEPLKSQIAEIALQLKTKDYLAQQYAPVRRYNSALESVLIGNQKGMMAETDSKSLHDVLPVSYYAAKVFVAKSYCQASEGDVAGSVQSLLAGLVLTDRMNGYTMLGNLFGELADKVTFDRFAELLPLMSLKDLETVRSFVDREVAESNTMARIIQGHQSFVESSLAIYGSSDPSARPELDEFSKSLSNQLKSASPQDLNVLTNELRSATTDLSNQMLRAVEQPESEWWDATSAWTISTTGPQLPDHATMDQIAQALLPTLTLGLHRVAVVELTRRAELRLLGLNAAVMQYRWHNHRLPTQLSEFASEQDRFDPLSNLSFVFKPAQDGTYRLYSQGRPDTGIVELNYAGRPSASRPATP